MFALIQTLAGYSIKKNFIMKFVPIGAIFRYSMKTYLEMGNMGV